jgi:hypothetical protein
MLAFGSEIPKKGMNASIISKVFSGVFILWTCLEREGLKISEKGWTVRGEREGRN